MNTLEMAAVALSAAADDLIKTGNLTLIRLMPSPASPTVQGVFDEVRESIDGERPCRPLILGLFVKYLSQCVRDTARRQEGSQS